MATSHLASLVIPNNDISLSLINSKFPLPLSVFLARLPPFFRFAYESDCRVGEKASPMGEWKQLLRIGKSFGGSGVTIANPSELTHTWRKLISKPNQGLQQDLQAACGKSAMDV